MNWYKIAQIISKKLLKNIEKKKQISLNNGWTPEEIAWASDLSIKLTDPSYFQWLLDQTRNGSANIQTREDDSKIFDALMTFNKLKDKKLISEDIKKLKTFPELFEAISEFEIKQRNITNERLIELDGANPLYYRDGVQVVKVTDFEAAQELFSDGWCVKQDKTTFYETYGPPYLLFNMYKKPYALYCDNKGDFKDEHDGKMTVTKTIPLIDSLKFLRENRMINLPIDNGEEIDDYYGESSNDYLVIEETINKERIINDYAKLKNSKKIGTFLDKDLIYSKLIKPIYLTPKLSTFINEVFQEKYETMPNYFTYINKFYNSIPNYIDKNKFPLKEDNKEILKKTLLQEPEKWDDLDKALKTKDLKNEALQGWNKKVDVSYSNYRYIPDEFKTEEFQASWYQAWLRILEKDPFAWSSIPEEMRTREAWKLRYEGLKRGLLDKPFRYSDLDDSFKTEELKNVTQQGWINKVKKEPGQWQNASPEFQTEELKKIAIDGWKIRLLKTPRVWMSVPKELRTPELQSITYTSLKKYIEDRLKDYSANFSAFPSWNLIPDEFKTDEFREYFTNNRKSSYQAYLQDVFKEPRRWDQHQSRFSFSNIPDEFRTEEMKQMAYEGFKDRVKKDPTIWKEMPEYFKTSELINIAYNSYRNNLSSNNISYEDVPAEFQTLEIKNMFLEKENKENKNNQNISVSNQLTSSSKNWYKTAQVNNSGLPLEFQTITDVPDYDSTQSDKPIERYDYKTNTSKVMPTSQYMKEEKGLTSKIVNMSPEEYINICVKETFPVFKEDNPNKEISFDEFKDIYLSSRTRNKDKIKEYTKKWMSGESNPPMVYLKYNSNGYFEQEGLHRALMAQQLGLNQIPVMIIKEKR